MKTVLAFLLRIYAGLTAIGAALLAVAVGALFASGALSGERLQDAARVLREGPPAPPAVRPRAEEEAQRDALRRVAEENLARRQDELRRLEARVAARALAVEADRARLEEDRRRHAEAQAQFRAEREAAGAAGGGAAEEVSSVVPLFSRMEGAEVAEAMKDWDDARLLRTLRALRPSKAADVLSALRADPRFEQDFRRVPPGSPKGTRARLERLFEALKE